MLLDPSEPARALLRALATPVLALLAAASAAAQASEAGAPGADASAPDVLVVLVDDLGWPELGDSRTPVLERLAAEGVTLTRFYAMPNCSPARHALLHGRWPRRTGLGSVTNSFAPPSPENPTPAPELASLPKLLRARGYRTALIGKWHLGQAAAAPDADPVLTAPQAHGFDEWLAGTPANLRAKDGKHYADWMRVDNGVERAETEFATRAQRDAAMRWWSSTPSPKFMLVSLSAVHQPLQRPPEELLPPGVLPGTKARFLLPAMIASVDTVVGDLHRAVDPERTLFLFLSDNGTAPLTYGPVQDAKGTTLDRGVRVPFLALGPGLARGVRCDTPVSIVDVMGTVCEAAGIAAWQGERGGGEDSRSFLGALRAPREWRPERSWVLVERYDSEHDDVALVDGPWKLRRLDGRDELYVLSGEPPAEVRVDEPLDAGALAAREALAQLRAGLPPRR
jgi:arylsulfatase A-like enzyme